MAGRVVQSTAAAGENMNVTDWEARTAPIRAAAATLKASELLWGGMMRVLRAKLDSDTWKPVLCFQKHKYDESALKLRTHEADGGNQETAQFAKIMQTHLTIGFLVHRGC